MRALLLTLGALAALAGGCGSSSLDTCERAAVHAIECNTRDAFPWNNNNACVDPDLCVAKCVLAAPCGGLDGSDTTGNNALVACLDACPGGSEL